MLRTFPASGRVVLVAHNLGTVVAMDLRTRLPGSVTVAQLVTVRSPLGLDTVFDRLVAKGRQRPRGPASGSTLGVPPTP